MELMANGVRYHIEVSGDEDRPVLVLLHGFTGSTATWEPVVENWRDYQIVAIDLIGHGQTESQADESRYAMERQLDDLDFIFEKMKLEKFTLLGYSMGGRTALAYACEFPEKVERLVLESASPGLKIEAARQKRREQDAQLAFNILEGGIEQFAGKWENIPLFDSQKSLPESVRKQVKQERLAQTAQGLSNSLKGMGTGSQQSYWGCLPELKMPVLLITGELDPKFCAIAREMQELLPNAEHCIISAGHAIHVEKPAEFATMVMERINGINEED
ncbi:2-succinyl-6-hydroxy-2,4-cyclohexadiene-1-carboxylate synthase [Planococcus sp. CP5-4]|uniref:2-succinyl-6-hydroxy-2, 4-cyclohexadiene-1-carboxylate synthase n=1 Tax=unclassified Planococcus (in: firmicutes) TaxID=2662419 RepID=UPI001C21CF8B|nr:MULTISPECIES: 2-succinyl-6-hydroxy-2,4-cyclohexadiene-1-carboxylate synthase [unclassified Planococcus (in: firmicutes)]MBU9673068.1 2-succinyl-6-hydroxy-2,4-cyclohexadiene-1-carboxylate synthase [Planococcus sp. CP5-4_YE]MBV0908840.1 2-succinyl-6-hydroxy-2,4-cyclohexadiene-1-carboxylate synthase [Planococcus sp. CP5-4_UN]MBW6063609.1 2-succinyl-6-hydroxy-2,4-cyclohexadiene-1-carboxylate synthase [Planococcus sp. CP5-4]